MTAVIASPFRGVIRTIAGDIPPEHLGWCQCHEHIFVADGIPARLNPALRADDEEKSFQDLLLYRNAGGNAIVDAQPGGCGRMPEALHRLSLASGVHIIASTGYHLRRFYADDALDMTLGEDTLRERYIGEINEGMLQGDERTGCKAGIVKIAVEPEEPSRVGMRNRLQAAIGAAAITGCPLLAHFEPGTDVFMVLKLMSDAKVAPHRLIACHLDRTHRDTAYHLDVVNAGAYLEYDSINRLKYVSHEEELGRIRSMLSAGYIGQMLLSLDTTNERLASYGGYMGLDYLLSVYRSMLLKAGVGETAIDTMMRSNPQRALIKVKEKEL